MNNQTNQALSLFCILTLFITHHITNQFGNAGKIHIPDDLDDVIDDEEDEEWKNWGKKKPDPSSQFDLNPSDLDKMDPAQIQAEMMKRHSGPVFGFVKLRFGVHRTPDVVSKIAMQWTKVSKTGGLEVKFMGMDLSTIMFTLENGQDMEEVKDFVLEQPDAYEVKIGDNVYRRPGDPPVEEVLEMLRRQDNANGPTDEHKQQDKEEL